MRFNCRSRQSAGLLAALLMTAGGINAAGGSIFGTVRAEGKEGVSAPSDAGAYKSRRYKFVETVDYEAMTEFAVFVDGPVTNAPVSEPKTVRVVVQKDAQFKPHILVIEKGTTVEWPNEDDIYHNVFSASETKPFDLGLYKEKIKKVTFEKPGRVDVFCSIHKNMSCILLVTENPYFDITDRRGRYRIENVPAGTYSLKVWHERMPGKTLELTVPEEGDVELNVTMGISGLPAY